MVWEMDDLSVWWSPRVNLRKKEKPIKSRTKGTNHKKVSALLLFLMKT
jgi:hypothetical protein